MALSGSVPDTSPRFQRVLGGGVASSREDVLDEYGTNMGTIGRSIMTSSKVDPWGYNVHE